MSAFLMGLGFSPDTFHGVYHDALRNLRRSLPCVYGSGRESPPCAPEEAPCVRDTSHAPAPSPWYRTPSART